MLLLGTEEESVREKSSSPSKPRSYPRNIEGGPGLQMSVTLNKLQHPTVQDAIT